MTPGLLETIRAAMRHDWANLAKPGRYRLRMNGETTLVELAPYRTLAPPRIDRAAALRWGDVAIDIDEALPDGVAVLVSERGTTTLSAS